MWTPSRIVALTPKNEKGSTMQWPESTTWDVKETWSLITLWWPIWLPLQRTTLLPIVVNGWMVRSEERRVGNGSIFRCDWRSDVCSTDLVGREGNMVFDNAVVSDMVAAPKDDVVADSREWLDGEIGRATCREREYISV